MSEEQLAAKRRRRSRAEISQLVTRYLASGLAPREFSARHGLSLTTLRRGLAVMRRSQQTESSTKWVAVEVSPADSVSGPVPSGLALAVGPYRIELARGFDQQTLGQLLSLLEAR